MRISHSHTLSCLKDVSNVHFNAISSQIALLGACSWVKAFSQSFTGSPVRVFEMKRFKLAMRTIGNVNLVRSTTFSQIYSVTTLLEAYSQEFVSDYVYAVLCACFTGSYGWTTL